MALLTTIIITVLWFCLLTCCCDCSILMTAISPTETKSLVRLANVSESQFFCENINDRYNHSDESIQNESVHINCSLVTGESIPLDLTEDGYLFYAGKYYAHREYCISGPNSAKLCQLRSSAMWRKCCPLNQVMDLTNPKACTKSGVPFRPKIDGVLESFTVMNTTLSGFTCPDGFHVKRLSTSTCSAKAMTRFRLSTNGTILYEVAKGIYVRISEWKELAHDHDHYCVDGAINPASDCTLQQLPTEINTSNTASDSFRFGVGCHKDQMQQMASVLYICISDEHPGEASINEETNDRTGKTTLLTILWLSTCPLLLGAALVNSCVIQKNVHGWILTCYLLSMLVLNILSVIVIYSPARTYEGCRPVDFLIKFMYMSTLCWMTSINLGLCKTFRFAKYGYTLPQPVGMRRFIMATLFSLGFPGISVTAAYSMAYLGTEENCKSEYCLLYSHDTMPYYTVPMFLMVLGNFAIFVKTLHSITTLRKETKEILRRQAQDHLKSFALFTKLFLLTGGIWLLRLVLFVLQLQGMYMSWGGVILEMVFSIPEIVFPIIIFHHLEFIKWSWNKIPSVSRFILKLDPLFHASTTK